MSDAQAKFNTTITATDKTGPTIAKLNADVAKVAKHVGSLGGIGKSVGLSEIFHRGAHAAGLFRHAIHGAWEGTGKLAGALKSLASPMEALGALGAVGGLFELTATIAENFGQLEHVAKLTGMATDQLERFRFVATMTHTDTAQLDKGLERFATHVGGAMTGLDKPAAQMFKALGIRLKDAHGQARSVADIFQDMFKAFEVNPNDANRDKVAQVLFGMRGINVAEMLGLTREKLKELFGEFDSLRYVMTDADKLNLGKFEESWVKMKFAVGELGKAVGAKLAPVLQPVVDMFTDWVTANKAWLGTEIADKVGKLVVYLSNVDWADLWKKIKSGTGDLVDTLEDIGAAIRAIAAAYRAARDLFHNPFDGGGQEYFEVTPAQRERFLNQQRLLTRMPMLMEPDLRGLVMPQLPGFGLPMPDFTSGLPGLFSLPPPGMPAPLHSLDGWGLPPPAPGYSFGAPAAPAPPVGGVIEININGAPPGTTATVTQQQGTTLRPRFDGDTGAAFSWGGSGRQ